MPQNLKRLFFTAMLVTVAGIFLTASPASRADSGTGTVSITGGSLSESIGVLTIPPVTLDGTDQAVTYSFPITVIDATGTGNGWNLTITSTTFTGTINGVTRTFPTSASVITGGSSACAAGSTCVTATNSVAFPLTIPAAATAPTAVKLFNATANTGMGKITVTPSVSVTVPGNAFAGSYSSVITLAVVSGP